MKRILIALLALVACAAEATPQPLPKPIVLTGEITRADHQTYREIPFTVPQGTEKITIDFSYTGKENRTVIDIGIRDPQGQRGWSGGNKSHIEIEENIATPSYRPGRLQPGEWKLVLGIPNIREGQTAGYTATVRFGPPFIVMSSEERGGPPPPATPLWRPSAWFRGDFHTHTAHSDGSCENDGERRPCRAQETFSAAETAGLDFVAITDHNTITQLGEIQALQRAFPKTLLIPGTEITTFNGHANVIGNTGFLDFQLGSPRLPTLAKLFDQVETQGSFISINHPSLPSGEPCMGCGWTVKDTDWSRVTAIEVINGASMRTSGPEGAFNGIAFWEKLLREGHRITAIAGSDNHDATDTTGARQSPVGTPTTVVYASQLSTQAIIAGAKSGRVFIDVAGLPGATLDMQATMDGKATFMGGEVVLRPDEEARLTISTSNLPDGARTEIVRSPGLDDVVLSGSPYHQIALKDGASRGWIRANVRDATGKLLLLGNPIYFRRAG